MRKNFRKPPTVFFVSGGLRKIVNLQVCKRLKINSRFFLKIVFFANVFTQLLFSEVCEKKFHTKKERNCLFL